MYASKWFGNGSGERHTLSPSAAGRIFAVNPGERGASHLPSPTQVFRFFTNLPERRIDIIMNSLKKAIEVAGTFTYPDEARVRRSRSPRVPGEGGLHRDYEVCDCRQQPGGEAKGGSGFTGNQPPGCARDLFEALAAQEPPCARKGNPSPQAVGL